MESKSTWRFEGLTRAPSHWLIEVVWYRGPIRCFDEMSASVHQGAAQPTDHALQDRLDVTTEAPKACKKLEKFYILTIYAHPIEFSKEWLDLRVGL